MRIEPVRGVGDSLVDDLARLVPQLTAGRVPPTRAEVEELLAQPGVELLVAIDDGRVVGMLTLVVYRIPSGVKGRIEAVVVDEAARGRGVGEALTREALDRAVAAGARRVELTSRPAREAANRLYPRLGFELVETNVYVWRPG
ncbi:MAG TPA: GNAT family N-acetyltransferase [Gaiellaceae bacterium]|nr:GNAT family N-acetyltransferase [Gaiellaceae bacterium]